MSVVGWGTSKIDNDWCWRSITLLQIAPSVIQLCGVWWIPESPRYLVSKDKADKALEVLVKHHGGGDINNATVQFEYREIKETISMEAQADKSSSYVDFLKTKGNRWRLAIIISLGIISQYSGNALFSNYIDRIYEGAGITGENKKLGVSLSLDLFLSCSASDKTDCADIQLSQYSSPLARPSWIFLLPLVPLLPSTRLVADLSSLLLSAVWSLLSCAGPLLVPSTRTPT